MTSRPEREPTLSDIARQLTELKNSDEQLRQEVERFNERFSNYQQSTQWVVQLAFTLIALATITVIVAAVFK